MNDTKTWAWVGWIVALLALVIWLIGVLLHDVAFGQTRWYGMHSPEAWHWKDSIAQSKGYENHIHMMESKRLAQVVPAQIESTVSFRHDGIRWIPCTKEHRYHTYNPQAEIIFPTREVVRTRYMINGFWFDGPTIEIKRSKRQLIGPQDDWWDGVVHPVDPMEWGEQETEE